MNDLDVYEKQNFGNQSGIGDTPALLIVDFVNGFADPEQFGGGNIQAAIDKTVELLAFARAEKLPIATTRVVYADDGSDTGVFCIKAPGLKALTEDAPASKIVDQLTPINGEYVVRKTQPSGFFGTDLAEWYQNQGVDTVLITGCTTSGCIRPSVIDAMSHNFKTVVVTDCVGDRAIGPHEANLFDMGQKYADLMTAAEVMTAINSR